MFLEAPDTVLIERSAGKRVDQKTEEIYHTTFDMPNENSIKERLKVPLNYTEDDIRKRLQVYHRHYQGVADCLKASTKSFNVDQPKGDIFNQGTLYQQKLKLKLFINQFRVFFSFGIYKQTSSFCCTSCATNYTFRTIRIGKYIHFAKMRFFF